MNERSTQQPADAREAFHRLVLDAIPDPIFVVDHDVRIIDSNKTAQALTGGSAVLRRRGGEVLHCIHALRAPGGCGTSARCPDCNIRNSVARAFAGHEPRRVRHTLTMVRGEQTIEVHLLVTTARMQYGGAELVLLVLEDVSELVALRRIVPICAHCRKVRDDAKYWQDVESYCTQKLDIDFSHGICPTCLARYYPEFQA